MQITHKIVYSHFVTLFFIIFICPSLLAQTPVPILEESSLPNNLGTYRHFRINHTDLYAAILNQSYQAEIYQQSATTQSLAKSIRQLALKQNFLIAVNGGYYTPRFQPAGLFIQNNKILRPLAKDPLLTACVGMNKNNKIVLASQRDACLHAFSAIQTGPVLIKSGELSNYMRKRNPKAKEFLAPHRRTLVALSTNHQLIILAASPTTLLNLATLLKEQPELFKAKKITTAINLDGGSSTGMYIRFSGTPFYYPEQKKVKTFIFFR